MINRANGMHAIDPEWSEEPYPGRQGLRRNVLILPADGVIKVELEDDFHHFSVTLEHDGKLVTGVGTGAQRYPWTTCPAAGPFLAGRLTKTPLKDVKGFESPLLHCTHLYDLAVLAARHALIDEQVLYCAFVADPVDGKVFASLRRNGVSVLEWWLEGQDIEPGSTYAGHSLRKLKNWAAELDPEPREHAEVLRRAVFIANGRDFSPRSVETAAELETMQGACFTFDAERSSQAAPVVGSKKDFTASEAAPLGDLIGTPGSPNDRS